jgi:transcriptional/translational regulatory protein YebC/TACO1
MTDVQETAEVDVNTLFKVPVVKAKGFIEVNTSELPDHVYREALMQGLKVLLNRGQTKITKEAYPEPEQLRGEAMKKAEETLESMYAGKIRIMGAKADKVPGAVMTEARRIARNLVKEELKRSGVKVSYIEASEITKAANALIAADPDILKQAEEELEKRARTKVKIDISAIPQSKKKIAAAEAKKAEKVLSAAKTGKIATRARPAPQA